MHVHAYLWVGDKAVFDREGSRRPDSPGFFGADVPPMLTAHWLLKPVALIRATWDEPGAAAGWLGEQLSAHAPRFLSPQDRDPARIAARTAAGAERLACGGDVSHGYYLNRPLFFSVALVTCSPNRAAPQAPCPGRSAAGPPGVGPPAVGPSGLMGPA
nr:MULTISPECIES: hypothetical protein [Streptomyces]